MDSTDKSQDTEPELPVEAVVPEQQPSTNAPHVGEINGGKVDPTLKTQRIFRIVFISGAVFAVTGLIMTLTTDNGMSDALLLLGLAELMFGGIAYFTMKLLGRI